MRARLTPLILAAAACWPWLPAQAQHRAPPADAAHAGLRLAGTYGVEGRNVDGSPYRGMALIRLRTDGRLDFLWQIGVVQIGVGRIDGNTVTVDFGDAFPAIYQLQNDGSLDGTWADGRASERLVPVGVHRI